MDEPSSGRSTDDRVPSSAAPHAVRLAAACLTWFAVVDVLNTIAAIADYEDAITGVTHGASDVPGALEFHALLGLIGREDDMRMMIDGLWLAGLVAATAAVAACLLWSRHHADGEARAAAVRRWSVAALALNGLVAANHLLVREEEGHLTEALDTRALTYPLWIAATAAVVTTAVRARRLARDRTGAQR